MYNTELPMSFLLVFLNLFSYLFESSNSLGPENVYFFFKLHLCNDKVIKIICKQKIKIKIEF